MTCSLFPENRDFLDQWPLENIWSNIAPVIVNNWSFKHPGSSIAEVVKNVNCIIVYSDILNYTHVTNYNFLLNGMIFCESI